MVHQLSDYISKLVFRLLGINDDGGLFVLLKNLAKTHNYVNQADNFTLDA